MCIRDRFTAVNKTNLQSLTIELTVDDSRKQEGAVANMIFSIPYLVSYLSNIATLYPGDLIFTGTPEGVGAVQSGNVVKASIPQIDCSVSVHIA